MVAAPRRATELEPALAELDRRSARGRRAAPTPLYTDVWVSMGDEAEAERRRADLAPYQLNDELLASRVRRRDRPALPARPPRRGDHAQTVLYGDRSAVWDQAENRLHAQKALLEMLLVAGSSLGAGTA